MSEDREADNLKRRPHYSCGDRVRVVLAHGPYSGVEANVRDVLPLQTISGHISTYFYTLELPNLARIKLAEEDIAPLASETHE